MTLEDDNKTEPEASPTKTATDTVPVEVASTETLPSSLEAKSSPPVKTKRSFDEISSSASTVDDNVSTADVMIAEENAAEEPKPPSAPISFKVVYAKKPYEVTLDLKSTIADLKTELFNQTGVMTSMQKLCFRGNLEDHKTLEESGIKNGVKIIMIGSKIDDIKNIDEGKAESSKTSSKEKATKEPLCQQKPHKKIIDKGVPEFATLAWINEDCPLPTEPLTGMVNKYGNKVRLTFKFESDEVWIGTNQHTQKLPMANVKSVISEPIVAHPMYHIMGLQVGPTEASRIWFYWVPAQYVRAIKRAILND